MRIQRKAITEENLPNIILLNPENERFLKWEKLVFWDEANKLQNDFSSRIPLTILFVILIIAASVNLIFHAYRHQLFASSAISAQEELIDKTMGSLRSATQFYLNYSYRYGEERYSRTIQVNRPDYDNAIIGSQRDVLLIPSNRELVAGSMNDLLFPLLLSILILTILLAFSLYYFFRWYRKILLIPAKITEVEQGEKHNNRGVQQTYEISYELISPKTKTLLKSRKSIPIRQNAPSPEQLLAILYRNDTDFLPL